jgi:hypothetical protein
MLPSPTEIKIRDNGVALLPAHSDDRQSAPRIADAPLPHGSIHWIKFGLLTVELVGLACLVHRYQIVNAAFFELFLLICVGFVINYFMPMKHRINCFLGLSLIGIGLVLGVLPGASLVAIGLGLVGIAHLPVRFAIRVALLIAAGLLLAALRAGWAPAPWSVAIWPILGAMFMYRLIVYVYDLKHGQAPATVSERLAYFFMLPNVCFPLFPVIDSRAFSRSYYIGERHDTHQRGIEWMIRGMVQLVLYRLVYQRLVVDPNDVANAADLVQHFVSLFLLYLQVSGQFHLIVGMLHLFGFCLPETHHLYYFSSSFTDFWRRINIYWKDFMMKVFYYPMFFRIRRLGPTLALVVSTAWVFALTWALHAYQLFWIRGAYEFTWNDVLFWTILCVLVIVNALGEARFGRRRALGAAVRGWKDQLVHALKILATFSIICVLWSFWSSKSLSSWFSLWPAALVSPTADQWRAWIAVTIAGCLFLGMFLAWQKWVSRWVNERFVSRCAFVLVQLFLLNAISISAVHGRLGDAAGDLVVSARFGGLNRLDKALLERGYYEDLLNVDRFGELAALYSRRPNDWVSLNNSDLIRSTDVQGLRYELRPNFTSVFKGAKFISNSWGMHDQEYTQQKPADCYRIVMLGASHVMGSGVEREQTFEAVLERRLNRDIRSTRYRELEILNCAVGGYYPYEQIRVIEEKVLQFEPDAIFYVAHPGEAGRVNHYLAQTIRSGADIYLPALAEIARRADIGPDTPESSAHRQLQPFSEEILKWIYREIALKCTAHNVHPVFVRLPLLDEQPYWDSKTPLVDLARDAGFTVFDLDGVYDVPEKQSLWIADWDTHPNAQGHQMVADRLYQLVRQAGASLGLDFDVL